MSAAADDDETCFCGLPMAEHPIFENEPMHARTTSIDGQDQCSEESFFPVRCMLPEGHEGEHRSAGALPQDVGRLIDVALADLEAAEKGTRRIRIGYWISGVVFMLTAVLNIFTLGHEATGLSPVSSFIVGASVGGLATLVYVIIRDRRRARAEAASAAKDLEETDAD